METSYWFDRTTTLLWQIATSHEVYWWNWEQSHLVIKITSNYQFLVESQRYAVVNYQPAMMSFTGMVIPVFVRSGVLVLLLGEKWEVVFGTSDTAAFWPMLGMDITFSLAGQGRGYTRNTLHFSSWQEPYIIGLLNSTSLDGGIIYSLLKIDQSAYSDYFKIGGWRALIGCLYYSIHLLKLTKIFKMSLSECLYTW